MTYAHTRGKCELIFCYKMQERARPPTRNTDRRRRGSLDHHLLTSRATLEGTINVFNLCNCPLDIIYNYNK